MGLGAESVTSEDLANLAFDLCLLPLDRRHLSQRGFRRKPAILLGRQRFLDSGEGDDWGMARAHNLRSRELDHSFQGTPFMSHHGLFCRSPRLLRYLDFTLVSDRPQVEFRPILHGLWVGAPRP